MMFDAERLLGDLLTGGISGSGRRRKKKRRRARGLGKTVQRAAFSPQGLTLLGGIAIAAFDHMREKKSAGAGPEQGGSGSGPGAPPLPPPPSAGPGPGSGTPRPDNLPPLPVDPTPPGARPEPSADPAAPAPQLPETPEGRQDQATILVEAMVMAAKADGTVDEEERSRIRGHLRESGASEEDLRFLEGLFEAPFDLDGLASRAKDPLLAAEVYAASLVVTDPEDPIDQGYLMMLARRLDLSSEMTQELHARVAEVTEETDEV